VDDHNLVAKQEHIEAIEAELDRMKKIATHVYEEMVSHTRCTSDPARASCPRRYLTHLLTCAPQVYMRDRSDAMHITSESTRGRRRSIRSAGPPRSAPALPPRADPEPEPEPSRRPVPPRAGTRIPPGRSLAVGLAPQSEERPIYSEPGRRAAPPVGPTPVWAPSHLADHQRLRFGQLGSVPWPALVAQAAAVSKLLCHAGYCGLR
jgi:hypothetical protein